MRLTAPPDYTLPSTFFGGVWSAEGRVTLEASGFHLPTLVTGPNWALFSGTGGLPPTPDVVAPLVHPAGGDEGVAFRGHLLRQGLVSWSAPGRLVPALREVAESGGEGAFAAAFLTRERAVLCSDLLGLGPLYYRQIGGLLAFATHPRLLLVAGDAPDLIAAMDLFNDACIDADRTLIQGVGRVPPGSHLTWSRGMKEPVVRRYWSMAELARPEGPATDHSLARVHAALADSLEAHRVLEGRLTLPLSGGWDSRRLLAHVVDLGLQPELITVRTLTGTRNLDAPSARQLATMAGLPHHDLPLATGGDFATKDRARQGMVGGESVDHTWGLQMWGVMSRERRIVLDGLVGDVLGATGWVIPELHDPQRGRAVLLQRLSSNPVRSFLSGDLWPTDSDRRHRVDEWLAGFPDGENLPDLVYLHRRTRRSTALCFQSLLPAEAVATTPYATMGQLQASFAINSADKLARTLQEQLIRRYWPELWRVPATRREEDREVAPTVKLPPPGDLPFPVPDERASLLHLGREMLSTRGRTRLSLAIRHPRLFSHWAWWLRAFVHWWRETASWGVPALEIRTAPADTEQPADSPVPDAEQR